MDYQRWAKIPACKLGTTVIACRISKRMETCLAGEDDFRGGSGPLALERGPGLNPLFEAFLSAVEQAGYPLTDDVNGFRQEGFARFDRNVRRGRRVSAPLGLICIR
ncbi:MAG: GMC family oxidoreductase N-terminal domain-containing protein [Myxococcota bacterium]